MEYREYQRRSRTKTAQSRSGEWASTTEHDRTSTHRACIEEVEEHLPTLVRRAEVSSSRRPQLTYPEAN